MKRFFNKYKEEIYKDDLKYVLINGFLASFFASIVLGVLNFFVIQFTNLQFSIFIIGIGYFIGRRINKSYYTYHIWYPTIGVIYFLLGYIIFNFTTILFTYRAYGLTAEYFGIVFKTLFSFYSISSVFYFLNPVVYIINFSITLNAILDLLFFIFGITEVIRVSKGFKY